MNIVLIGMRGSGKSTVGKILAEKLKRKFIEMDDLVAKEAGMSIPEIVKKYGWPKLRKLEAVVAKRMQRRKNCIIATGGGVILKEDNVASLKNNGLLIWLNAAPETLIDRIGNDPNRPSLTGKSMTEDLRQTFKQRRNLYLKSANKIVDTEEKNPLQVANEILTRIDPVSLS